MIKRRSFPILMNYQFSFSSLYHTHCADSRVIIFTFSYTKKPLLVLFFFPFSFYYYYLCASAFYLNFLISSPLLFRGRYYPQMVHFFFRSQLVVKLIQEIKCKRHWIIGANMFSKSARTLDVSFSISEWKPWWEG